MSDPYATPPAQQGYPPAGHGQPPYPTPAAYGQGYGYQPAPSNGMAIASFVTSLAGSFAVCGVSGIVGIVLGIIALNRSKELQGTGRGMAIAGIVIGAVQIVLLVGFIIAMIVLTSQSDTGGGTVGSTV